MTHLSQSANVWTYGEDEPVRYAWWCDCDDGEGDQYDTFRDAVAALLAHIDAAEAR